MEELSFKENKYNNILFERTYPDEAPGWINSIYNEREAKIINCDQQIGSINFKFRYFKEDSDALNGDIATIGTFEYFEGNFIKIETKAINYNINLTITNPNSKTLELEIIINQLGSYIFKIENNETKTISFKEYLTDRSLELTFKNLNETDTYTNIIINKLSIVPLELEKNNKKTIYIASDSTVQTYTSKYYPQAGWGQFLHYYLFENHNSIIKTDPNSSYSMSTIYDSNNLTIINKSIGGRSSKSFIKESKLHELVKTLSPNDLFLIQWGHNDASNNRPMRYVPVKKFINYIKQYVYSAIDRGAIPILVTPVPRYSFKNETEANISFNNYRTEILEYANKNSILCIDLGLLGSNYLTQLEKFKSASLYMKLHKDQFDNYKEGIDDNTHFNKIGAKKMARFVAQELSNMIPNINFNKERIDFLCTPEHLTAEFINSEKSKYVLLKWDKVANADFYILKKKDLKGNIIKKIVTIKNSYSDYPQSEHKMDIIYEITAHHDLINSKSNNISLEYPFIEVNHNSNNITGINLYEIDTETIPGKVSFSLRFNINKNIENYKVILINSLSGQQLYIDSFNKYQAEDLHSYIVNKENNLFIRLIGFDKNGIEYRNNRVQIPTM